MRLVSLPARRSSLSKLNQQEQEEVVLKSQSFTTDLWRLTQGNLHDVLPAARALL